MAQVILKASATGYKGKIPVVKVDCDNNGVVSHGNTPKTPLSTNQTQVLDYLNTVATLRYILA